MPPVTARVLVYDNDPTHPLAIKDGLKQRGYYSIEASTADEAVEKTRSQHPDVVVVNTRLTGAEEQISQLRDLVQTRHAPVIFIGDGSDVEHRVHDVKRSVIDFLPTDFRDVELFARISSLLRLNTMQDELQRRRETAEKYGIKDTDLVVPPIDVSDERLAVLAWNDADVSTVLEIVGSERVQAQSGNKFEIMDELIASDFDALVAVVETGDEGFLEFCDDLRKNSRLFNLPFLAIVGADSFADVDAPYKHGVTEVLYHPVVPDDLNTRLDALVIQQRYRLAMRRVFAQLQRPVTGDGLTGLYGHGFLHEHLTAQLADAEKWQKHLTVGVYDIKELSIINRDFGYVAGDLLLRQIGSMVGGLVRGEDLAARVGGDSFVVVLPETAPDYARIALGRIAAVISNTEFAVTEVVDQPMIVYLQHGVATIEAGDTAESIIARARTSRS